MSSVQRFWCACISHAVGVSDDKPQVFSHMSSPCRSSKTNGLWISSIRLHCTIIIEGQLYTTETSKVIIALLGGRYCLLSCIKLSLL